MTMHSRPTIFHSRMRTNGVVSAGTISVLHSFAGADGATPQGTLQFIFGPAATAPNTVVYGSAEGDGVNSYGSVFSQGIQSGTFTDLAEFNASGAGGAVPLGGLAGTGKLVNYPAAGPFFGSASTGGQYGFGGIYATSPSGGATLLYSFTGGNDGATPSGTLLLLGNSIYGTTSAGGADGYGTIFKLSLGRGLKVLHTFTGGNDGGTPLAGLTARIVIPRTDAKGRAAARQGKTINANLAAAKYKDVYLYGTTSNFGAGGSGNGTLYRISTESGKLTTLVTFVDSGTTITAPTTSAIVPGATPSAELVSDLDGNLYGSTAAGGTAGFGEIFGYIPGKKTFAILHDFATDPINGGEPTGSTPLAPVTLGFDGQLYGTTSSGSANGDGNVFKIDSIGFFHLLYEFAGPDGASPQSQLVDGLDGNLYGTTSGGGANGSGEIFAIGD